MEQLFDLIAIEFGLSAGVLRPDDSLDKRLKHFGTKSEWPSISTVGELMSAWCGLRPDLTDSELMRLFPTVINSPNLPIYQSTNLPIPYLLTAHATNLSV